MVHGWAQLSSFSLLIEFLFWFCSLRITRIVWLKCEFIHGMLSFRIFNIIKITGKKSIDEEEMLSWCSAWICLWCSVSCILQGLLLLKKSKGCSSNIYAVRWCQWCDVYIVFSHLFFLSALDCYIWKFKIHM